ncbi:hypothetical protein CUR178_01049 [Leishmania enriettii]|uniref:Transporter n=1 Tax=Leishmania enriettii TaxID=5663 RepID=A0A836KBD5_LEIEN|nr:hypothetical protein CUR178_01049 [Leishmania enriettii]
MHAPPDEKVGSTPAVLNRSAAGQQEEFGRRKKKITPLPMNQLFPMTFVLLNESICSTMLLPFVGLLVAHLRGVSVNEAGYNSGMLIGVFMLGQVVSSRMWGWMSDKYGRRFPLISGLFTSGLMMLGFGLSTTVWMCAFFRFMHGLFNGNVMVAKTMMADITDKTNAAKGFAFVSLCYGIGVLIGPTLGGMLYDPANSSALRWAHIDGDSIFSRKPALLPSLVIFIYTNIGMLVCTFFVMESNVKAQPLPLALRYIYPCFWREPRRFVHASLCSNEEAGRRSTSANSENSYDTHTDDQDNDDVSIRSAERLVGNVVMTRAVASLTVTSPVLSEDPRFDHLVVAETLSTAAERASTAEPENVESYQSLIRVDSVDERGCILGDGTLPSSPTSPADVRCGEAKDLKSPSGMLQPLSDPSDGDGLVIVVNAELGSSADHVFSKGVDTTADKVGQDREHGGDIDLKRFGYKQAFERPVTRTMLLLYMLLSAADMAVQEIMPLWAIAHVEKGGLGFGADRVGYIVLTNSVPCVASNLLFYKACSRYVNKLALFRLAVAWCGVSITLLPFTSYVDLNYFLFPAVVFCTGVRQFFASWCYGLVTMLTAQSAPAAHVGSIMGINQSCGALVRALIPFAVTPLFAWSITSGHSFPLDHVFVFFLSALTFASASVYSTALRTNEDAVLEMVDLEWTGIRRVKDSVRSCYNRLCASS